MWENYEILVSALALSINFLSIEAGTIHLNDIVMKKGTESNNNLMQPAMRRELALRMGTNRIDKLPFGHMNSIPLSQYSKMIFVMGSEAVKNVDNQRALTDLVKQIMSKRHNRGDAEQFDAMDQGDKKDEHFDVTRLAPVTMKSIGRWGARTARPFIRSHRKSDENY